MAALSLCKRFILTAVAAGVCWNALLTWYWPTILEWWLSPPPPLVPSGRGWLSGAPKPKCIVMLGERVSGTHFAWRLLEEAFWFDKPSPVWKHAYISPRVADQLVNRSGGCLFVLATRNPYDWLLHLHRSPFHIEAWTYLGKAGGRAVTAEGGWAKREMLDWLTYPYDCRDAECDAYRADTLQCRREENSSFMWMGQRTHPCDVSLTDAFPRQRLTILDVRRLKLQAALAFGAERAQWFEHIRLEDLINGTRALLWLQHLHKTYGFTMRGKVLEAQSVGNQIFHGSDLLVAGDQAVKLKTKTVNELNNRCYLKELTKDITNVLPEVDARALPQKIAGQVWEGLSSSEHIEAALGYRLCRTIHRGGGSPDPAACTWEGRMCGE